MSFEVLGEVSFPQLGKLQKSLLDEYSPAKTAKRMEKAMEPVVRMALGKLQGYIRRNHMGPTGNLLRGTVAKVEKYDASGNAVGLVGFRAVVGSLSVQTAGTVRKGPDRAFHAGFLEFGTKERKTKGSIASSFKRFGPFKMVGKYPPVKTTPAYPNAFFKRAPKGMQAKTGSVPPLQPIKRSFNESKAAIETTVNRTVARQLLLTNKVMYARLPA
jgi:hypothetical protein